MPDDPPSQMIRVPKPLIGAVRELSRLHREGHTKAMLDGIERLVATIDSSAESDIDSASEAISTLTERLDRLEAQRTDSNSDIDISGATQAISAMGERLDKIEQDINSLSLTIQDLSVRVSDLEGFGDIDSTVSSIASLERLDGIETDSELIAEQPDQTDITTAVETTAELPDPDDIEDDSEQIAKPELPPRTPALLTLQALASRLAISDRTIGKQRDKGKVSFAEWSRHRDPEGIAWTWKGRGGRGKPFRFVPLPS